MYFERQSKYRPHYSSNRTSLSNWRQVAASLPQRQFRAPGWRWMLHSRSGPEQRVHLKNYMLAANVWASSAYAWLELRARRMAEAKCSPHG